jgi:hypothetical protein
MVYQISKIGMLLDQKTNEINWIRFEIKLLEE